MDNLENFNELFPMEVKVTQDIIKNADTGNNHSCIGALALAKGLGKRGLDLLQSGLPSWGNTNGHPLVLNGDDFNVEVCIGSYDENGLRVEMMDVTEPFTVTFKID
jgi:hypothetical protein